MPGIGTLCAWFYLIDPFGGFWEKNWIKNSRFKGFRGKGRKKK